jgi:predicted RNase H-like nuclease (RuvC/YqgF family)
VIGARGEAASDLMDMRRRLLAAERERRLLKRQLERLDDERCLLKRQLERLDDERFAGAFDKKPSELRPENG